MHCLVNQSYPIEWRSKGWRQRHIVQAFSRNISLRLAAERGLIDVQDVLSKLRASGFYIDENVLRTAFEPWLRRSERHFGA